MSVGSIIVLIIIIAVCVAAVAYNIKHRGACECSGCDGCASAKNSNNAQAASVKDENMSCGACPMANTCNHKK